MLAVVHDQSAVAQQFLVHLADGPNHEFGREPPSLPKNSSNKTSGPEREMIHSPSRAPAAKIPILACLERNNFETGWPVIKRA